MELEQILSGVPGLSRRFVYYLESRGYIRPAKVHKQRIARREYGEGDLKIIREVWCYYQRGYVLQKAYDLATSARRTVTYLGVQVPWRRVRQVLERLKEQPRVVEASVIHGANINMLVKTDAPEQSETYHTLVPLLAELGISGLPDISLAQEGFHRPERSPGAMEGRAMMAYVLMKVPGKDVEEVMERLKAFEAVREASTIYGESDILARIEVDSQDELDTLVMERLHGIPAVESTRTFVVIRSLRWSR